VHTRHPADTTAYKSLIHKDIHFFFYNNSVIKDKEYMYIAIC